jgi:predicted metal-dependent hydrolase
MPPFPYKLVRSRRRSVALTVARDATVTVRVPLRTPIDFIESFLKEKCEWIEKTLAKVRERARERERRYEDGEIFWYLGERYPLRVSERARLSVVFSGGEFVMAKRFHPRAKEVFSRWYTREAKRILSDRVRFLARENKLAYGAIKVNAARTRWGSCSGKGNLNFSFRLAMAPLSVIDYVVAHELAHLVHRDHSRNFWRKVASMLPEFETERRWLKKNGHLLEC